MEGEKEKVDILMDSGASISVMSDRLFPSKVAQLNPASMVRGIGGAHMAKEELTCEINMDCGWKGQHPIRPMPLQNPRLVILGRDFLSRYGNTEFDWKGKRVRLGEEWIFVTFPDPEDILSQCKIDSENCTAEQVNQINGLLEKYRDVFATNNKAPARCNQEVHQIRSKDDSICKDKVRRLPMKWLPEVNRQVEQMEKNGIIKPSVSPFNSNVLLAEKKDNTKRFVTDFRTLNKNTEQDAYPLPNVDEMLEGCKGAKYLTQLDLASGYWGIPLRPEDSKKTAFTVPKGRYEYIRMPFGLKNSQATFQRTMDKVVSELERDGIQHVTAYVDNLLIESQEFEEHMVCVEAVLKMMRKRNLSLRADKAEIGFRELLVLGFVVNGETIRPDPANVQKITDYPCPKTKKQVQRFLGIANFNRKFVKGYSDLVRPLTLLTASRSNKIEWGEREERAFQRLKTEMASVPNLFLPDWKAPFQMQTDASGEAVGGVLYQTSEEGDVRPIAYHSKTLSKPQRRWSATEKELFAVIECTRKWRVYCTGKVCIFTDHKPLEFARNMKDTRGKVARWILELDEIDYLIKYLPGKQNVVADAFSRTDIPSHESDGKHTEEAYKRVIYLLEDYPCEEKLFATQKKDKQLRAVYRCIKNGKRVATGPFKNTKGLNIAKNGLVTRYDRIVVPSNMQAEIIAEVHGQYHSGAENTCLLLKQRFWWRGMDGKVKEKVAECTVCSQCKNLPKPKQALQIPDIPNPMESIAMDFGSLPQDSEGYVGFLLIVDIGTSFISAIPLKDQLATTLEKALWTSWFSTFGMPKSLRSDQAKNMNGTVINALCKKLYIKKKASSPYHPEGNGMAERCIGKVKTMISSMSEDREIVLTGWREVFNEVVLATNCCTNRSSGFSAFEHMFGKTGRLPMDNFMGLSDTRQEKIDKSLIESVAIRNWREAQESYKKEYDTHLIINEYAAGQEVLVKRTHGKYPKIAPNWVQGPFHVVRKIGPVNWEVKEEKTGKSRVLHHNLLKPVLKGMSAQLTTTSADSTSTQATQVYEPDPSDKAERRQQRRPTEERMLVAGALLPATEERGPVAGALLPATEERVPVAGALLPATEERVPVAGALLPATEERGSVAGALLPATEERMSVAGALLPATEERGAAVGALLPANGASMEPRESRSRYGRTRRQTQFYGV